MSFLQESLYFGFVISLVAYLAGVWIKKKVGWAILNPLLVSVVIVIAVLKLLHVDYASYNNSAKYISYLLTPSTVCLAIPLYKQLELLKKNFLSVIVAITSGVAASAGSIFLLCMLFGVEHIHYVSFLPKSITTAIGMGVSEEAGGIVTITVVCIIITGIFGNIIADLLFQILKIREPIAGPGTGNLRSRDRNSQGSGAWRGRRRNEQSFHCCGRSHDSHCGAVGFRTDLTW